MNKHIQVLQVSTADSLSGAEKVACNLHHAYRARGLPAWLAVGDKNTNDPFVLPIPNDAYCSSVWAQIWFSLGNILSPLAREVRWARRLRNWLHWIGQPSRLIEIERGHEDFESPGTWHLLDLPPEQPDIVHCHNLHRGWLPTGGYFDLRALPWISHQVPVVLTLHDQWLFSGHCAHSFDCERWKIGCGHCPDLTIYPAVRRDATAYNWRRKHGIYAKSLFYVATPSRWLMQKVEQSMLAPAMMGARIIPNGVDLSIFHPADGRKARAALGISQDARVLLFTANRIRKNIFKDYQTMRAAVAQVAEFMRGQSVLFIALGEDAPAERIGKAEVRFVPYEKDPEVVARYYQAADIYVHAARADTFPNTILEALACGTPVVATAVGGIGEQVKGLQAVDSLSSEFNHYSSQEATGILVPAGDTEAMAFGIEYLLRNELLPLQIGQNAAKDACQRFDLQRQADHYLEWYSEILEHYATKCSITAPKGSRTGLPSNI